MTKQHPRKPTRKPTRRNRHTDACQAPKPVDWPRLLSWLDDLMLEKRT